METPLAPGRQLTETEGRLAAQLGVARALAEAETLADATHRILQAVCEGLGWDVGELWECDVSSDGLRCVDRWSSDAADAGEFVALTREMVLQSGEGLPGRVWETREPAWVADVVSDPDFVRAEAAADAGLHGAAAFPILSGNEIRGVVAFFSTDVREPDAELLQSMAAIGSQVGQFIDRRHAEEDLRQSEARKSAMLEAALDCIVTMNHEGRIVEFNPAAEATFGRSRKDVVGKEMAEIIIPPALRDAHRRGLANYLETGEGPVLGKRLELVGMRADGSEFPIELAITRVAVDGPPLFTGYIRDITARKQAEDERTRLLGEHETARAEAEAAEKRLAFLAEASAVLSSSLDYEETLASIGPLAVPALADWCVVHVLDDDGTVRRLAATHADPAKVDVLAELERRYPPDPDTAAGYPHVLKTGKSELIPEIPESFAETIARDEEHLELLLAVGVRSNICVPLTARGNVLGTITLASAESGRVYGPHDLSFAEELARRAAVAIENARLYHEAHMAFEGADRTIALLDTLLNTAPVGFAFFDKDLRYVLLNEALAEINGLPVSAHIGKTIPEVLPGVEPRVVDDLRHVVETGQPIADVEVTATTPASPDEERHWLVSYYPVQADAGALGIGAVVVDITERKRTEEERSRLLARERAARTEAERTSEILRAVEEVTEATLAHLDIDDLLRELLERITAILGTDTAAILLAEGGELAARAAKGLEEEVERGFRIPIGAGFAGRVAADRTAIFIPDVSQADVLNPLLHEKGVRSMLGVPLLIEGRVIGVLHVGTLSPRDFTDEDARVLQVAADRIALAIAHARAYAAERAARAAAERFSETLTALQTVTEAALAHLSVDDLLPELLDRIKELLETDTAAALLLDETGETLVARAARGLEEAVERGTRIPVGKGFAGRVAAERRPIVIDDVDHADVLNPVLREKGVKSLLGVPLVIEGSVIGVLHVGTLTTREFTPDEAKLLQLVADRVALALENVRLFREAEERANAARVLNTVGDGVFLVDRGDTIHLWNQAAEAITGLRESDVLGRRATEAIPGWSEIAHLVPVAAGVGPVGARASSLPLDLGDREVWVSISGVDFDEGTVYAFRDLTEERRLDELKAEFVATASHELRTPLAAVYGAAMTLRRRDLALDEQGRERLLEVVAQESERLARIIDEILWASRLDSGQVELELERVDPRECAERVVEAAKTHLPDGLQLDLVTPPDGVPALEADSDKVRQVLTNLVENAVKYSPDGGLVEVRVEPRGRCVRFAVRDEGLGIPPQEQTRIFEKFYRLDPNLTRGVGGTGLGLYISRELIKRMHGRIWVSSREGEGSTFFVELPVAEDTATGETRARTA